MPRGTPFQPGNKAAANRGPNKVARTVKETVLSVFTKLQDDKEHSLESWARTEPTEFYKIAAKLIPTEITGSVKTIITVTENE